MDFHADLTGAGGGNQAPESKSEPPAPHSLPPEIFQNEILSRLSPEDQTKYPS